MGYTLRSRVHFTRLFIVSIKKKQSNLVNSYVLLLFAKPHKAIASEGQCVLRFRKPDNIYTKWEIHQRILTDFSRSIFTFVFSYFHYEMFKKDISIWIALITFFKHYISHKPKLFKKATSVNFWSSFQHQYDYKFKSILTPFHPHRYVPPVLPNKIRTEKKLLIQYPLWQKRTGKKEERSSDPRKSDSPGRPR